MQNNYYQYGQLPSSYQYPACNNQQGYQYINQPNNMQNNYIQNWQSNYNVQQNNQINNNQINNIEKDDSSSRDQYYNDHVACIVFGNKEFKEENEKIAKKENKTLDELVGTDFSFGKYLNFEANEKEWQAQLEDLKRQLSGNNPKFANLKGIKFFLYEHGGESKHRLLNGYAAVNPPYYKSKRFQQVAKIINDCFLDKNQDNKLYFVNKACYGAYFFNELKKNVGNDVSRSNNIYEILSNEFGSNRDKVYCSQLIPQSGMNFTSTLNSSYNPYRNRISYSTQIRNLPRGGEYYQYDRGPHDFRKKYHLTYNKLFVNEDLIPSPECRIYFPLKEFRNVVPNYYTKPITITLKDKRQYVSEEKYYKVDDETLKNYTGKTAKDRKNDFLKWGDKPKYAHFDENQPFTDPLGNQFDNLQQCCIAWSNDFNMKEAKKINQQKQLQKDGYDKNKFEAKYNNHLHSLYNDKVNYINGAANGINGCVIF